MKSSFVFFTIIIGLILIVCCAKNPINDLDTKKVIKIKFVNFFADSASDCIFQDQKLIKNIVNSLEFGREIPMSKHIFQCSALFYLEDENKFTISFEQSESSYFLRYKSKQYITSKRCFDTLIKYCNVRKF